MKTIHEYVLINEDDDVVMSTEIDKPNPTLDPEFWQTFMTGNYFMIYLGAKDGE